jgi:hypothetical protein
MSANADADNRALNAAEREMVAGTLPPAVEQSSREELKALQHRLRQAHQRAHDIGSRQRREMRGKADPHGAKPASDATGSIVKTDTLMEAIKRVDQELDRRVENETGKPSPSEFARKALEMKMAAEAGRHPDSGRTAKTGMKPKKRTEEFAIGTPRSEMGRVSQQQKVSQGRKDSGKG